MEHKFEETLHEYLEGHLTYNEADKRLLDTPLDPEQAQMWKDIKPLDEGLVTRTDTRAELPWLVTKVTSKVNATQRAKDWIKLHKHDLLGGLSIQYGQFLSPSVLKALGAALIGGFTGFILGARIEYFQQYQAMLPPSVSVPLVTAAALGLIAALVVVSPSLRKYYS